MAVTRSAASIRIQGLTDFRKEIKALGDASLRRALREANKAAAETARQAAVSHASTRQEQAAAGSLKVVNSEAGARLSSDLIWFGGAEFGAMRNQRRVKRTGLGAGTVLGWNQFRPWRGNGADAGYFLWPGLRAEQDQIIDRYDEALQDLASRAFPD